MGCHTWFYNKIADAPNEHIEILRKKTIASCKNAWILKCSYQKWMEEAKEDLDDFLESAKNDNLTKEEEDWLNYLKKRATRGYYSSARKAYLNTIKMLEDPNTPKDKILEAISAHNILFDVDDSGYYDLGSFGWADNYRVYGYPEGKFHNAEDAIKFLEEYDNGKNIVYDFKEGMCDEIREIVRDFFKQFPNGYIDYG